MTIAHRPMPTPSTNDTLELPGDLPGDANWGGASAEAWPRPDGASLWVRRRRPNHRPTARLMVLHGYLEHGGRYARLAQAAADAGMHTVVPDLRGHGRSSGRRGDIGGFAACAADVQALAGSDADGPLYIFAHSNGGLLALWSLLFAGLAPDALVLSNPFTRLAPGRRGLGSWLAPHLGRFLPQLSVPAGIAAQELTRDLTEAARLQRDPMHLARATLAWARQAHLAQAQVAAAAAAGSRLKCRSMWLLAQDDRLACPAHNAQLAAQLAPDAPVERVADGRHELLFDLGGAAREASLLRWLAA